MANYITILRILLSIVLLFCTPLSIPFYICYLTAGITDMADGAVARKTGTVSEFGSRLDTIVDFIFLVVCLIKLFPVLDIPNWLYVWAAVIMMIKVINVVLGFVKQRSLIVVHSLMNKITGALLFILPLTLNWIDLKYSSLVVCVIATIAATHECYCIVKEKNCPKNRSE